MNYMLLLTNVDLECKCIVQIIARIRHLQLVDDFVLINALTNTPESTLLSLPVICWTLNLSYRRQKRSKRSNLWSLSWHDCLVSESVWTADSALTLNSWTVPALFINCICWRWQVWIIRPFFMFLLFIQHLPNSHFAPAKWSQGIQHHALLLALMAPVPL